MRVPPACHLAQSRSKISLSLSHLQAPENALEKSCCAATINVHELATYRPPWLTDYHNWKHLHHHRLPDLYGLSNRLPQFRWFAVLLVVRWGTISITAWVSLILVTRSLANLYSTYLNTVSLATNSLLFRTLLPLSQNGRHLGPSYTRPISYHSVRAPIFHYDGSAH